MLQPLFKAICTVAPKSKVASLLYATQTTPEYGMPIDELIGHAAEGRLKLTVVAASWDVVHRPHALFWQQAAVRCSQRAKERAETCLLYTSPSPRDS